MQIPATSERMVGSQHPLQWPVLDLCFPRWRTPNAFNTKATIPDLLRLNCSSSFRNRTLSQETCRQGSLVQTQWNPEFCFWRTYGRNLSCSSTCLSFLSPPKNLSDHSPKLRTIFQPFATQRSFRCKIEQKNLSELFCPQGRKRKIRIQTYLVPCKWCGVQSVPSHKLNAILRTTSLPSSTFRIKNSVTKATSIKQLNTVRQHDSNVESARWTGLKNNMLPFATN